MSPNSEPKHTYMSINYQMRILPMQTHSQGSCTIGRFYSFTIPKLRNFDLIVPLYSKILKEPLIVLQGIVLRTSNDKLHVLYGAFQLCLNTSSGQKLAIKMMSLS